MSDKLKSDFQLFSDRDVFIPTKTIKMLGPVDDIMFEKTLVNLHTLDSVTGDITIKLMSPGGDLDVARGIYDLIRGCKNRVNIQCYGLVASAATLILQAGDLRCMSENSKLMIHVGSESMPQEHPRNIDALYNESRKDEAWIENIYLKSIREKKKRFPKEKLRDILTWDTYIDPKEALDLGLIDKIGELS